MGEFDALVVLVPFEEREVDDPAQFEPVLVDQAELFARPVARRAGEGGECARIAGDEETGVARLQAELGPDRLGPLRSDVLGERTGALDGAAFLAPEDVAEARLALALCP